MTETVTIFDIFSWGVDYGQLLMEEEYQNNWADAVNCFLVAQKTGMPTHYIPHREPHSDKWLKAKKESFTKFKNYLLKHYEVEK